MDRFYMLYAEGKGAPTKKHFTVLEAHEEAERLARKEEKPVYVLLAWKVCEITKAPVQWFDIE